MEIFFNNKLQFLVDSNLNSSELKQYIEKELGLVSHLYYLLSNGKRIENHVIGNNRIYIIPRLLGGKGGFGSMLRAIGAQIEKTTNREACRDLSGRRLRDINEEQRLKNWINQQAEREKEAKERKKKKLERLCEKPRHEFKDLEYDKERSELPEKVEDALLQGLQASCSSKRKATDKREVVKKKKPKLWVDDELDDDLSSAEEDEQSDSEENEITKSSESEDSKILSEDGTQKDVYNEISKSSESEESKISSESSVQKDASDDTEKDLLVQTNNDSKDEESRKEENL